MRNSEKAKEKAGNVKFPFSAKNHKTGIIQVPKPSTLVCPNLKSFNPPTASEEKQKINRLRLNRRKILLQKGKAAKKNEKILSNVIDGLQSETTRKEQTLAAVKEQLEKTQKKLILEAAKNRTLEDQVKELSKENETLKLQLVDYKEMKEKLEKQEIEKIRKSFEKEWYAS